MTNAPVRPTLYVTLNLLSIACYWEKPACSIRKLWGARGYRHPEVDIQIASFGGRKRQAEIGGAIMVALQEQGITVRTLQWETRARRPVREPKPPSEYIQLPLFDAKDAE